MIFFNYYFVFIILLVFLLNSCLQIRFPSLLQKKKKKSWNKKKLQENKNKNCVILIRFISPNMRAKPRTDCDAIIRPIASSALIAQRERDFKKFSKI